MRLAVALERRADVMGRAYGEHVSVYVLLGRTQNELFTDDSFAFNKVCGPGVWGDVGFTNHPRNAS